MSFLSDSSRLALGRSSRITITDPIDPNLMSNSRNQVMRESLQSKMVDLGRLQTQWRQTEATLNDKCESLVDQLRDSRRQAAVEQSAKRSQHLKQLDSMIHRHQVEVIDLQAQIKDAASVEDTEDPDVLALDQEIASLQMQIEAFQTIPAPEVPPVDKEGYEKKRGLLEERIAQLKDILQNATIKKEEDSKAATQMLQQLIVKNQETDDVNQAEIAQCVDELNKLEELHNQQVSGIQLEIRESVKSLTERLKSTMEQVSQIQREVANLHKQQKREMKADLETAEELRQKLAGITEQHHRHLNESAELTRMMNGVRSEYTALHKELEVLNAERARETIEQETLMRQLKKMDDSVISEMTESFSGENSTISFSGF